MQSQTIEKKKLRQVLKFERDEIPRLIGVLGTVVFLHVLGWGLLLITTLILNITF